MGACQNPFTPLGHFWTLLRCHRRAPTVTMARTARSGFLETRTARLRLPPDKKPYWVRSGKAGVHSAPQVRAREVDDFIAPAAKDGLHHEKREAFRHLEGDRRRHHELRAVHDGIDHDRALVC